MQRHTVATETRATSGTLLLNFTILIAFNTGRVTRITQITFSTPASDVTAMSSKANFDRTDLGETAGRKMAGLEYNINDAHRALIIAVLGQVTVFPPLYYMFRHVPNTLLSQLVLQLSINLRHCSGSL
jgi:hypothetical protein